MPMHNNSLESLQQQNTQLNKKVKTLEHLLQSSLNIGEQITSNHLQKLFLNLKEEKLIKNYAIYNNIIVENEEEIHQVDHFVICDHGFFAIETKHWKGDIYFNFHKDNLKDYNLDGLKKYLFTDNDDSYMTFILCNENNQFQFKKYGHPFQQVMKSTTFCQSVLKTDFIENIIYFNHRGEGELFVGNAYKYVETPSSEQELSTIIRKKIQRNKSRKNMDSATIMSHCETLNKFANNDATIINIH
ncbi:MULTISPECIES: nuclease-related domain-containing protein [Staphylococcus]|uniref:nuclease-related domain-containing protein n=1 Tax=Staphylococcus TaxID=1279 RepID=UPI0021CF5946|nr:nuclease-related domain-containing protein [Staphylococcus sp. IVB6181]UXV35105.1 NERD domain-containing protein [Staphylococcus sp. IVB6181]